MFNVFITVNKGQNRDLHQNILYFKIASNRLTFTLTTIKLKEEDSIIVWDTITGKV